MLDNHNFIGFGCDDPRFPILLSVPHAGRDYPPNILQQLRISADQLLRLEDRYADLLVRDCMAQTIPTVIARAPRAIIDLNRGVDEVDADMVRGVDWSQVAHPSAKTRGGLGLIPRRLIGAGDIWKQPIDKAELDDRINDIHRPYHDYISAVLNNMQAKFGVALLVDVHSMPSLNNVSKDGEVARWVIGDRFGMSADNIYTDLIMGFLSDLGYKAVMNAPYAGGYMLERHGNPSRGIYALQIEIDRNLYLDENNREPNKDMSKISMQIRQMVNFVLEYFKSNYQLEAAE